MDKEQSEDRKSFPVFVIILAIIISLIFIANAVDNYNRRCSIKGCDRNKSDGSEYCRNHTCRKDGCSDITFMDEVYCAKHQAIADYEKAIWKAEQDKLPRCAFFDCPFKVYNNTKYCIEHLCGYLGCTERVNKGVHYCREHRCPEAECGKKKEPDEKYCWECKNKKIREANTVVVKKSKWKSKPDCDDYDSYEDFMDDWDGYMPDGSDAEDYWEDW